MDFGRLLNIEAQDGDILRRGLEASGRAFEDQGIDQVYSAPSGWQPGRFETRLARPFSVTGPGTYEKQSARTLHFAPADDGWHFKRQDLREQLPIAVDTRNVWTANRSIVLRSGSQHNYMRMTEHIIANRLGLGLDNALISSESGDPPLFDIGSMPIVEGILDAGLVEDTGRPLRYFTVKERATLAGPNGSFLTFIPAKPGDLKLSFDVAIDFPTAIGLQRIQFDLCQDSFTHGAHARTNCSRKEMFLAKTIGKLFADIRNLGYTSKNILVAGKTRYYNEPLMLHNGKSLEAVWHRSCLDLIAALSLFSKGRLAGHIVSFKAGHCLDCRMMTLLELNNLLVQCN